MIPKKIHYCWFGGKPFPEELQQYMKTWDILKEAGYEIIRWDESNCSFDENDFVRNAYNNKCWAFVSDFYHWKVLYENGGIYFDTDILVKNTLDDFLEEKCFCSWMYDCAIGTAVIGSEAGGAVAKSMLAMYETGKFSTETSVMQGEEKQNPYAQGFSAPNNEFVMWQLIESYPNLKLNGKEQRLGDISIYPDYYFDRGRVLGKEYCRHMYSGLWADDATMNRSMKGHVKLLLKTSFVLPAIRKYRYSKLQKNTVFYKYRDMIGK